MLSEAVKSQPMRFTGAVMYAFSPIPQKAPFYDGSGGPFLYAKMSRLLCLKEASGFEGWIPCSPIMENTLLPLILTGETKTYTEWRHHVYWQCRNAGFSGETAGEVGRLDYAMLDILAKRAGLPMHRFLGADTDSVIVYGSGGSIHLEGDALAQEMERFLSFGHKTVKMKVAGFFGTQLDRDIERVKLVREVIGPEVKLALDANQVFTVDEALAFADRVEKYDIDWFEEPIHSHDFEGYEELVRRCPIRIGSGESFRNHYMFQPYIRAGVEMLQPVAASFAGAEEWLMVSDMAKAAGCRISSGGMPMMAAPLVAAAGENAMEEFLEPCNQPLLDYQDIRLERRDGRFYFPDVAGLPFRFDLEKLEKDGYLIGQTYIRG